MLRSLLMACVLVVVPLQGHANPTAETEEMDFLDLVDGAVSYTHLTLPTKQPV